jgi:hypothetical protein
VNFIRGVAKLTGLESTFAASLAVILTVVLLNCLLCNRCIYAYKDRLFVI